MPQQVLCCRTRSVDVVLVDNLDTLGHKGQLVSVKPGYARNFLVPSGLAKYATPDTVAKHQVRLNVSVPSAIDLISRVTENPVQEAELEADLARRQRSQLRRRVEAIILQFNRATTDGINLYGPITAVDVRQALLDSHMALKVKTSQIRMPTLGGSGEAAPTTTTAPTPEGEADQAGDVGTADEDAAGGLDSVGAFTVQVEAQPGLWCHVAVQVQST